MIYESSVGSESTLLSSNHIMMTSPVPCDTPTTTNSRSSWYDDDHDDHDKNDDLSFSSSYSMSKANLTVPCWGGWLLKLTTHRPPPPTITTTSPQAQLLPMMRKSPLKVIAVSSSSTTSDDSEIGHHHHHHHGNDSEEEEELCYRRCLTPPRPPIVSFPKDMNHDCQEPNDSNNHNHDNDNEEELMDDIQRIRSLEREGDRYEQDGFLVEALSVYQRLLELHRATGQSANRIGKVHYRTGMIQYKRHCYNEALCHFDQALFIYQVNYNPDEINDNDDNDDDDVALDFYRVYVATGHVHLSNHNPYRAIDYFRRALQYVQPEPNTQASQPPPSMLSEQRFQQRHDTSYRMPYYAQVLHALGTAYETIGDEKEAQFHYHKAVTVKVHAAAATATTTTEVADQGN